MGLKLCYHISLKTLFHPFGGLYLLQAEIDEFNTDHTCLIVPGRANEDLVSGLGMVAGSWARICLMA